MSDLRLIAAPPRPELQPHLRHRIRDAVPGWRPLAEDVLGADTRIDFVGVEPGGRLVIVLVGEHDEDLELVARGLAQRAWLEPRVIDWLKLAPELDLRPEAGVAVVLLCPAYRPEALAAARALGPDAMGLATYRFIRNGNAAEPVVERLLPPENEPGPARQLPPTPAPPAFRTGISEADLDLTDEERSEFE